LKGSDMSTAAICNRPNSTLQYELKKFGFPRPAFNIKLGSFPFAAFMSAPFNSNGDMDSYFLKRASGIRWIGARRAWCGLCSAPALVASSETDPSVKPFRRVLLAAPGLKDRRVRRFTVLGICVYTL